MPFSSRLLEELDRPQRTPMWVVESLSYDASSSWGFGRAWGATTNQASGTGYDPVIRPGSVRIGGTRLALQSWVTTLGSFSFDLVRWDSAVASLRRGYILTARLGFAGWALEDFEVVAFGRLYSMTVRGGVCSVVVQDPSSLLVSRQAKGRTPLAYFGGLLSGASLGETTVRSSYVAADATIAINSTSGFERETGGNYCLRVTPTSGSDFYLTATGTAAGPVFSGLSSTGKFGTTAGNAGVGQDVVEVALLQGHPMTILAKVLTSTGDGTNGSYDTLPETWGTGLPADLFAAGDMELWRSSYGVSTGVFSVDVLIEEPQTSGLEWLRSRFASFGVFLAMRQGQLTVRCAVEPTDDAMADAAGLSSDGYAKAITDADIAEVIRHDLFPSSQAYLASQIRVSTSGTRYVSDEPDSDPVWTVGTDYTPLSAVEVGHHPAVQTEVVDLRSCVFGNDSAIATSVADRVGVWAQTPIEEVELRLRRWKAASLCVGDVVALTCGLVSGRKQGGKSGMKEVLALVVSLDLFDGPGSRVVLAIPST